MSIHENGATGGARVEAKRIMWQVHGGTVSYFYDIAYSAADLSCRHHRMYDGADSLTALVAYIPTDADS